MFSGTLLTKAGGLDKNRAKLIKAGLYASKNLCYHLDERHKRAEDGYSRTTDTAAWGKKIKEFVEYKRSLLTKEVARYLRAPMFVGSFWILMFTSNRPTVCRLRRIISAYTDDRPYSIDLVSAVGDIFTQIRLQGLTWSVYRCNGRERSRTRCMT